MDIVEHKINQIIEKHREQIETLEKLKRSLAHDAQAAKKGCPTIALTPQKVNELRKAYEIAIMNKEPEFTMDGKVFVTTYAKYVLEYYDSAMKSIAG